MIIQTNLQPRIVVKEELKPNNSPLKLKIAFLNQEIKTDAKKGYFKLLIWFAGQNYVQDFDFNLFLKSEDGQIVVPLENLQPKFQPDDQNYLTAKIPSDAVNEDFNELTYTLVHDQFFSGQGRIFLNLENESKTEIDNELIFYENQKSMNLIQRQVKWEWPKFYFNHHYSELMKMGYQTFDESSQVNLIPVQEMASLVKNNTWSTPLQFLDLTLPNLEEKKYNFKPSTKVLQVNDFFKISLLNHLTLNEKGQIVEGGNEQGLLLNPLIDTRQAIKVKVKVFNLTKELTLWTELPKLNLSSQFAGDWIEV